MEVPNKYHIYALIDPRNLLPFYVGVTLDPKNRLRNHLAGTRRNTTQYASGKYIKELLDAGLEPVMQILEIVITSTYPPDVGRGYQRERHWINSFRREGFNLTNDKADL